MVTTMSEDQIVLAENGSLKNRLRLSLQMYKKSPLLNIRFYYEDKEGEMKPTKKGISITRNNFLVISDVLKKHSDGISTFLDNGIVNETLPNWTEQKTQALDAVGAVNKIETKVRPMPGKEFASVSYQGSKALVSLNSSHSQVDQVKDKKESKEVLEGVAVAFDLAQRLISEEESNEVQHALDRFRTEFSRQLRNLPNQRL
jgi:hypothetical protein